MVITALVTQRYGCGKNEYASDSVRIARNTYITHVYGTIIKWMNAINHIFRPITARYIIIIITISTND
jgi:hypothetical protein